MRTRLISILAMGVFSASASGQAAPLADAPAPSVLLAQMRPGATLEAVLANSRKTFRNLDANGDGRLDSADAELHQAVARAQLRAGSGMRILSSDLDGDGSVTEAELRTKRQYDQRLAEARAANADTDKTRLEDDLRKTMAADTDKDGRITWSEAANLATTRPGFEQSLSQGMPGQIREVLAFASAQQNSLSAADFEGVATKLFRSVDIDSNGTISLDEFAAVQRQIEERQHVASQALQQSREEEARAGCTLPPASPAARVVLLSAYEGDGLSTTAIGSQDVEIRTGSIMVEPGNEPLYVVIAGFRPAIWRFAGAVNRVERVALASQTTGSNSSRPDAKPLVGATGVPAEKITFLPRLTCLGYFTETPSGKAAVTAGIVRRETGKAPIVAGRYNVSGFSIPSGEIRTTDRTDKPQLIISKLAGTLKIEGGANVVVEAGASDLASEVARFYPGGIVEIDPATVVASEKTTRYDILPSQAGLLQLVQRGALVKNKSGELMIKQKIRFPAGLYGSQSARFLLLRGVPTPDGNPGHSCVISEETGRPLAGSSATC